MAYRDTTAADVCSWLPAIISNERWFGNEDPTWTKAQTSTSACHQREKLIKSFQRVPKDSSLKPLISRLASCHKNYRCYSGACPECTRALQRFFASEIDKMDTRFFCVSIMARHAPDGSLNSIDPQAMHQQLIRLLKAANVSSAVGGLDFSFNTDSTSQSNAHWSAHYWLFAPEHNSRHWLPTLRTFFKRSECVRIPVRASEFDGDLRAAAYAVKNDFKQRQSYIDIKGSYQSNRVCRNTRERPIPALQRRELAQCMNQWGLCSRLFTFNCSVQHDASSANIHLHHCADGRSCRPSLAASREYELD